MTATTPRPTIEDTRLFGPGPRGPLGTRNPKAPRGRHRKPRPRKVLLVAGGLALAAGALSLVRLTPDTGVGTFGASEPDQQAPPGTNTDLGPDTDTGTGTGTGTDHATNAAATIGSVPTADPSATSVMGGVSTTPTPGTPLTPTASTTTAPLPYAAAPTTIPEAPNTPASPAPTATTRTTRPHTPATTAAPQPARPPARTTSPQNPAPAPAPTAQPTQSPRPAPGLCVPIIGLCVQQQR